MVHARRPSLSLPGRRPVAASTLLALLSLAVVAGLPPVGAARKQTKGVKITLQAKWQGTPLLHEAAEFLADEDPALFWRFVEGWQRDAAALGAAPTPDQCWQGIQAAAVPHLSPNMARLLTASLAARQYSPKLETYRQLAEESAAGGGARDACCWVLLGGAAFTEAAALEAALQAAVQAKAAQLARGVEGEAGGGAGAVYAFDHIYAPADSLAPPLNTTHPAALPVELFAPIGSACAAELHAVLAAAVARADSAAAGADAATAPRLAYAWRPLLDSGACAAQGGVHACTALGTEGRLVVPGYGAELALKNMEYNAQDDAKQAGEGSKAGEEAGDDEAAGQEAGEEDEEDGVLQVKLKSLGLQAAQRILNAAANASASLDPLLTLQELAQDFPRIVRQLSSQKYGKSLRTSVEGLQRYIPAGAQFLLLNGLTHDMHDFSLHAFIDVLRREVRLHDALSSLGLPPAQLREALLLRGAAAGDEAPPRLRLASEDGIAWVNDLERDSEYEGWPTQLQSLLMPMYPGRMPTIARNILNAIYAVDPGSPAALEIGALLHQMDAQKWPLRMALVPVVPTRVAHARGGAGPAADEAPSPSERMGRLLAAIHARLGGRAAIHFLYVARQLLPAQEDGQPGFDDRLWQAAKQAAEEQWPGWSEEADEEEATAQQAIQQAEAAGDGCDSDAAKLLGAAAELAHSTGLAGPSRSGVLVFNGVVSTNDGGSGWQGVTMGAVQAQLQAVQEDVYMQRLPETAHDLLEEILKLHSSIPRYNPRILPLDAAAGYVRISGETEEFPAHQLALTGPLLGPGATLAGQPGGLPVRFFGPEPNLAEDEDAGEGASLAAVTHWVIADVASRPGLALVAAALQHRSTASRLALLVNPGAAEQLLPVERVVVAVAAGLLQPDLFDLVDQLDAVLQRAEEPGQLSLAQLDDLLQARAYEGGLEAALSALGPRLGEAAAAHARFVRRALRLASRANAVVTNGRVVQLPGEGDAFEPHDFELLELFARRSQYSSEVAQLVKAASQAGALRGADPSAVAAAVSSALAAAKPEEVDSRSGRVSQLVSSRAGQRNLVRLPPAGDAPPLLVQAVLNPLSKPAQRLAPLLSFLRAVLDVDTQLLLNPQREYDQLPLKTFYRYALPPLGALAGGGPPGAAAAAFAGLPPDKVLTLGMDEPEPWLVEPVQAQHDLDNLRLAELAPGQPALEAVFELEALMLTGMCLDLASLAAHMREQIHPRGVQLQLLPLSAPEAAPPLVDTLVMSNLGYFQLKAGPGLWKLRLAPGRSRELYTVASSTGASSSGQRAEAAVAGATPHQVPVALTSFGGKHMHLFLRKHPDRLQEDVLEAGGDAEGQGSVLSKLSAWTGGGAGVPAPLGEDEGRETIHVFTVASGHMYERLQKIMILSAIKRTPARVKFWFIKNYMSPQMKAFVPYMAEKYGFDYE